MTQLENELSQCRSLLQLAIVLVDAVAAALQHQQNESHGAEMFLSQHQSSKHDKRHFPQLAQFGDCDKDAFPSQPQNARYDERISTSHPCCTLTTVTCLTERSLVVHMRALQRRGLLVKTDFRTYALTDVAMEMMREARNEKPPGEGMAFSYRGEWIIA